MKKIVSLMLVFCLMLLLVPQNSMADPIIWPPPNPTGLLSPASAWLYLITMVGLTIWAAYESYQEQQFYEQNKAFIDAGCTYNASTNTWDCGGARCY